LGASYLSLIIGATQEHFNKKLESKCGTLQGHLTENNWKAKGTNIAE
jgi:hypothetical protein